MSAGAVFFGSAAIIALLGAVLLVWALFADRSRGRKRCPRCWYDMSAAVNLRCPECGRQLTSEKQLLKTRRRWKVAFATLLPFALAGFLAVQPKVERDGWWSISPTTLMLANFHFKQDDAVIEALERRMSDEHEHPLFATPMFVPEQSRLYRWQWRWLARRTVHALEGDDLIPSHRTTLLGWAALTRDMFPETALRTTLQQVIARHLSHGEGRIRFAAVINVVDAADPEGSVALVLPLVDDEDTGVRTASVASLRKLAYCCGGSAYSALINLLEHDSLDVSDYAASALCFASEWENAPRVEIEQAVRAAYSRMAESGRLRHRVVSALSRFAVQEEWLPLVRKALESDDPETREHALYVLYEQLPATAETVDAAMRELHRDDATADSRQAAWWILGHQAPVELLRPHEDAIADFVQHEDEETSAAAVRVLGRIAPERTPDYADYP